MSKISGLTYSHISMYYFCVARAATTSDAFNAVAEPRRRDILNYLALQERRLGTLWRRWNGAAFRFQAPTRLKGCGAGAGEAGRTADSVQRECGCDSTFARVGEHV